MVKRVQNFLRRLHHDEVGLNTVEVILLLVIAIVLLIGIWAFVRWAMGIGWMRLRSIGVGIGMGVLHLFFSLRPPSPSEYTPGWPGHIPRRAWQS